MTQEIDLPRGVQLHFWLAGGDLDELMEIERDIEKAAHENGIVRVSIIGRRGWRAKLDGFKEAGVILVKEIKLAFWAISLAETPSKLVRL